MKIRIYQIDLSLDTENVAFRPYAYMQEKYTSRIPEELYCLVYEGTVATKTLEDVYFIFNMAHPENYWARSLSMSDVVEVIGEQSSTFYLCDLYGFVKVNFDVSHVKQNG